MALFVVFVGFSSPPLSFYSSILPPDFRSQLLCWPSIYNISEKQKKAESYLLQRCTDLVSMYRIMLNQHVMAKIEAKENDLMFEIFCRIFFQIRHNW